MHACAGHKSLSLQEFKQTYHFLTGAAHPYICNSQLLWRACVQHCSPSTNRPQSTDTVSVIVPGQSHQLPRPPHLVTPQHQATIHGVVTGICAAL